ncbi:YqiJ family protein [Sphingosinicella terrae]|jgi:membrane protein implicated in regulation of membrane protease activity|uniref:YqiJ family protein n=1 Tax=Sphingosinicella terrae TaxID=2172047 RepID=UPI000E0D5B21|nr:YqiJ family protein [Sphingosinicella terrae]
MLDFLLAPEMLPFSVALGVMATIGLIEAIGLGAGAAHLEADVDGDAGHLLSWLGIGEVPLLIILVVLLALFAMIGMAGQQLAAALLGSPVSPWIAAPIAFVAALPLTGSSARLLARILPHDETSAVPLDSLVGRRATIVVGTAAAGSPARAQVRDVHGQRHYVMVEPIEGGPAIGEGETALLVERLGDTFIGLSEGGSPLAIIDHPAAPRIQGG